MKKWTYLTVLVLAGFALTACSPKEAIKEKTKLETAVEKLEEVAEQFEEKEATNAKPTFSIGEAITFEKAARITITGASYTDERNMFEDVEPLHVLVVSYNVENLSDKDYYVGSELELYVNGKKMETYPVATTVDTISAGRSFEGDTQAFAVTEDEDYELEVEPSSSFNTKPAIVTFSVS